MINQIFYILGGAILAIFIYEIVLKPFFKGISEAVTDYYAKKKFEERQEDYKKRI